MAVGFGSVGPSSSGAHGGVSGGGYPGTYVTSLTFSHTVAAGENELVCSFSVNVTNNDGGNVTGTTTTSVKYGGVDMTSVLGAKVSSGSASSYSDAFHLTNPTVGTANIVITLSAAAEIDAGSVSFTGAGGGVANGVSTTSVGTNSSTLNVTSTASDMVYLHGAHGDSITGVGGTGTARWTRNTDNQTAGNNASGATFPGTTTVAGSMTASVSDSWCLIGFSVVAGGGATAAPGGKSRRVHPARDLARRGPGRGPGRRSFYLHRKAGVSGDVGGTTFLAALDGTITPTGALVKQANKGLAGTVTPAGAIVKVASKALAGTTTPAGAIAKAVAKLFAGTITPTGSLTTFKVVVRAFAGTITPTGALVKTVAKSLAGTVTPTGGLAKLVAKQLAGTITPTGALALFRAVLRAFAGTVTPVGTLAKQARKGLTGTVTPVGSLAKTVAKVLAGTITPTGALSAVKVVLRTFAGTVTPTGALVRQTAKGLAGTVTPAGTLSRAASRRFAGTATPAGALAKQMARAFAGAVAPAGSLRRLIAKALVGAITPTGSLQTSGGQSVAPIVVTGPFRLHRVDDIRDLDVTDSSRTLDRVDLPRDLDHVDLPRNLGRVDLPRTLEDA